jgi:Arc/MetJ-type ribon-helix-helix transcriptional regulator
MKYAKRTALRLTQEQRIQIDELIKEGKYPSLSEIMRKALEEFLSREGVCI